MQIDDIIKLVILATKPIWFQIKEKIIDIIIKIIRF